MTQRNSDYLERRGLAHVEPIDVFALFRIVDENKYVFFKCKTFFSSIFIYLLSRKRSHMYRYQLEQQQQQQPMMIMTLMMDEHGQHQQQPMIMF
jgi:hypothetical protein